MMSVLSVKFLSMILLFGPDGSYMSAYKKILFNFINVDARGLNRTTIQLSPLMQ